jgi:hypothetical protein
VLVSSGWALDLTSLSQLHWPARLPSLPLYLRLGHQSLGSLHALTCSTPTAKATCLAARHARRQQLALAGRPASLLVVSGSWLPESRPLP